MMKRTGVLFLFACIAWAAGIDGEWRAEVQARAGKRPKAKATVAQTLTLTLKSDGNQLTGSVRTPGKKHGVTTPIQNGTIQGGRFSFTTVQRSKKGEQKLVWQGEVQGDHLTGTRGREGRRRGVPFTARRAG